MSIRLMVLAVQNTVSEKLAQVLMNKQNKQSIEGSSVHLNEYRKRDKSKGAGMCHKPTFILAHPHVGWT